MAGGQHLLIAMNVRLDRVGGQANLVRVRQFGTDLPDRPVAGKAALAQPTHHIPAQDPPRHSNRGLGFWTERLRMGRAGARGAMRQLADQMQGPVEREHPMMAMVTRGQRTTARPAPPLLDSQFDLHSALCTEGSVWSELSNTFTVYQPHDPVCAAASTGIGSPGLTLHHVGGTRGATRWTLSTQAKVIWYFDPKFFRMCSNASPKAFRH
jgi:hypothetical protein